MPNDKARKRSNPISALTIVATFVITFTTMICLVLWPLPTAAMVLAGSGMWVVRNP